MDRQTFEKTVQQYAEEMRKMAARSRFVGQPDYHAVSSTGAPETLPVMAEAKSGPQAQEVVPVPADPEAQMQAAPAQDATEPPAETVHERAGEGAAAPPDVGMPGEINPPESGEGQDPLQEIDEKMQSYEEFIAENTRRGELRVQTNSGRGAFPVPGAQVTVEKEFTDGTHIFATGVTDVNGVLEGISLPAPSQTISQTPSMIPPYATYHIIVTHPQFRGEQFIQVPIFEGIKSIQPVRFVPLQPNV